MKRDEPGSDHASPLIAVFAMLVLAGLLIVPGAFIVYGGGGTAIGGLLLLGGMILCQSAVFAIGKMLLGSLRTKGR